MKDFIRCTLTLLPFLLFGSFAIAQCDSKWEWQNPTPQGHDIYDSHVFDKDSVLAVGEHATVLWTENGGKDWDHRSCVGNSTAGLQGVHFPTGRVGWAVGEDGVILRSEDGGQHWAPQQSGTSNDLNAVHFVDTSHGMAVGNEILLRTRDGGATWSKEKKPDHYFQAVQFQNNALGWITGWTGSSTEVFRTIDSGMTWDTVSPAGSLQLLNGLHFQNDSTGWVVGREGTVYSTSDSGNSWTFHDLNTTRDIKAVHFENDSIGWLLAELGNVHYTNDQGSSWKSVDPKAPYRKLIEVFDLKAASEDSLWIFGWNGTVFSSTDRGDHWTERSNGNIFAYYSLNDVAFFGEKTGLAVGDRDSVYRTTNGGASWDLMSVDTSGSKNDIHFVGPKEGWVVGDGGSIIHTMDQGKNWKPSPNFISDDLYGVDFYGKDHGWAVGKDERIIHTSDGGQTWTSQWNDQIGGPTLRDVDFISKREGWAVGDYGVVFHTDDAGKNWSYRTTTASSSLYGVHFIDSSKGFAVGSGGTILSTEDGGASWSSVNSGTAFTLNSIHFITSRKGWIAGSSGILLFTKDGGDTWIEQASGTSRHLKGIHFPTEKKGWIVGAKGVVLHTDEGGITSKPTRKPSSDQDLQLSPNPARKTVRMKLQGHRKGKARTSLFSSLGNEIKRTRWSLGPGRNEETLDVSGMESGLYLVRVTIEKEGERIGTFSEQLIVE